MSVEALSFLCNNLTKKIKKLSLYGICAFDFEDYILEEEHVIALANRCPQLEELDLGFCRRNWNFEVALSTIIEKLPNLVKLRLPDGQILSPMLLKLGSMPKLKHLQVCLQVYDETNSKSLLIKALVKNLPNLKINEGIFEIAHPDPRHLGYLLWEMQSELTQDFL